MAAIAKRDVSSAGGATNRQVAAELSIDARQARSAEDQRLALYQAAAWLTFRTCTSLHIVVDGSRFGQPARELEVSYAFSADQQLGVWMPVQVLLIIVATAGGGVV